MLKMMQPIDFGHRQSGSRFTIKDPAEARDGVFRIGQTMSFAKLSVQNNRKLPKYSTGMLKM